MTTTIDIEQAITNHYAKFPKHSVGEKEKRFFEYDMVRIYHNAITMRKTIAQSIHSICQSIMDMQDDLSHEGKIRLDSLHAMIDRLKLTDALERTIENELKTNYDGLYRSVCIALNETQSTPTHEQAPNLNNESNLFGQLERPVTAKLSTLECMALQMRLDDYKDWCLTDIRGYTQASSNENYVYVNPDDKTILLTDTKMGLGYQHYQNVDRWILF